jgi:hypothetical protein
MEELSHKRHIKHKGTKGNPFKDPCKSVALFPVTFARYGMYSLIRDSHFRHGMPVQEISNEASVLCYSAAHSRRGTWST